MKKALSGGERKRLNIGLDMIGLADIYLFDEPTSGLSSKDSEHVIEIIRSMSHNKIVLVTIHQPSSKIFQMFNKVILLDKGGRLVFFGTPTEALNYFAQAENQQQHGVDMEGCASCGSTRPEFIFDVLETPLRDMSGDIIYEENSRGQLVPARRYSPEFWRDKYESYRLLQDVKAVPLKRETRRPAASAPMGPPPRRGAGSSMIRWRDEWTQTAHAAAPGVFQQAAQPRQRASRRWSRRRCSPRSSPWCCATTRTAPTISPARTTSRSTCSWR